MAESVEAPPLTVSPWTARRSLALDTGLTVVLLLVGLIPLGAFPGVVAAVFTVLQIAPLVIRRLSPTVSFALVATAMAAQIPFTSSPLWGQVAMPIAVYSVTAYAPRDHSRVALVVAGIGGVVGPLSWIPTLGVSAAGTLVAAELFVVAAWALGALTRTRQAYVTALIDRSERVEREAEQRVELAAADERARIAREMHDIVAHGLSVVIVQADGARYAVHKDPDAAAAALAAIADTGREALGEMRRLLGVLKGDADTGMRPQPGLADLEALVEQARVGGMDLVVEKADPLPTVPAGVGLTVYRVLQEALTNARRHAGPQVRVLVRLQEIGGRLELEVSDDGRGPSGDAGGHGLLGMSERVAVHGGRVHSGPRPGGGFLLRAEIPLAAGQGR